VSSLGHDEIVEFLLSLPEVEVNKASKDGYSALNWASFNGHDRIVQRLLSHEKIDVNHVKIKIKKEKIYMWIRV